MMQVLSLRWYAKYGHFLRAEANVNALSYPVPPRTAVLGLLAALLGLKKDTLPEVLGKTQVAIGGTLPQSFWHRVNMRKNFSVLPLIVKQDQKGRPGAEEEFKLILQQWLWKPDFQIYIAMPDNPSLFAELSDRVTNRRWHFSPCMGLSELLADVDLIGKYEAKRLPAGKVKIASIFPQSAGRVLIEGENLGIQLLRMPYTVDYERIFAHQSYFLERCGRSFTVETDRAWKLGEQSSAVSVVFS